ncbi:MAG: SpoIIE family protein phosphatase [Deltaproteobacteria bacterium]|nr:SpoIIE family protein phosphatase [Deltaproteobacteria bacterium]
MGSVDYHLVLRALLGAPTECGDTGIIRTYDSQCFLGLVDALGHGKEAYRIACLAHDYLERNFHDDLVMMMKGLHEHLKGTRGIVAALCRMDINTGELLYVGVGNICVKIMGPRAFTFVPRDGIIGYVIPTPCEQHRRLYSGDTLVMYSDGIREHFDPLDCAGLFSGSAQSIASGLLRQFGKKDDDASCIALRYTT